MPDGVSARRSLGYREPGRPELSRTSFLFDKELHTYVRNHSGPVDAIAAALIAETAELPEAGMQISQEQGQFLSILVRVMDARRIIEIGTFTGYSALTMARAMGPSGTLVACDVSEEWTSIGRRYWEQAGVADRIDLRLGQAIDTLASLAGTEPFDLVFIDADKSGYPAYFDAVVPVAAGWRPLACRQRGCGAGA